MDVPPTPVVTFVAAPAIVMLTAEPTATAARHHHIVVDPGLAAIIDVTAATTSISAGGHAARRTDLECGCYQGSDKKFGRVLHGLVGVLSPQLEDDT
jgi:hypothetical protein